MAEVIHTIITALFSFDRSPEHFAYNATVEQCTFFISKMMDLCMLQLSSHFD